MHISRNILSRNVQILLQDKKVLWHIAPKEQCSIFRGNFFFSKESTIAKKMEHHILQEKGKNHGYIFFSLSLGKMSMPFLNCVSGMVLSNYSVCPVKALKSDVTPLLFESSSLSSGFAHHHYHLPNEASLDHSEASVYLFLFTWCLYMCGSLGVQSSFSELLSISSSLLMSLVGWKEKETGDWIGIAQLCLFNRV